MIFDALKKLFKRRECELTEREPEKEKTHPEQHNIVLSRVTFPDNYKSPSGGFCNYARYSGRGLNPTTGRRNQIKDIYGKTLEEALTKAADKTGFHEIELSAIPMDPPTEPQLDFAKKLHLQVPPDATKDDLIFMLGRVADSLDDTPLPGCPQSFANYLDKAGFQFSAYISEPKAQEWAINMLPAWEKCQFYAYCVWRHTHNEPFSAPDTHQNADIFSAFADRFANDTSFLQDLKKKNMRSFLSPHGNENTLKTVEAFFEEYKNL